MDMVLRDSDQESSDGRVMAIRALQESGLVADDGVTLLSEDPSAAIKTDTIERHRDYALSMLDRMVEFSTTRRCRLGVVLKYFGEPADHRCGRCDNCQAAKSSSNGDAKHWKRSSTGQPAFQRRMSEPPEAIDDDDPARPLFEKLRAWRRRRAPGGAKQLDASEPPQPERSLPSGNPIPLAEPADTDHLPLPGDPKRRQHPLQYCGCAHDVGGVSAQPQPASWNSARLSLIHARATSCGVWLWAPHSPM